MNTTDAPPASHTAFDELHWRNRFDSEPGVREGETFDDYGPAYRYGTTLRKEYTDFDANEERIRERWEKEKGQSRLDWSRARGAVKIAWFQDPEFASARPEELFHP